MLPRIRWSFLVISFSLGTALGAAMVTLHAKAGMAEAVYQQRIHASEVRQKIGLPPGQVFRRVGGTGDLPDVIWQLEYLNADAMKRDLDARAQSREFDQEVRVKMRTLIEKFSRGFYQPADRK